MSINKTNCILAIFLCLVLSCTQSEKKTKQNILTPEPIPLNTQQIETHNSASLLEPGKLYNRINCAGSSECAYALYLPLSFNKSKKIPVLLFFDPQGNGTLPLEKYKTLADRYGYIIVGSHFSKNGVSLNLIIDNVKLWIKDLRLRLPIDENRIYLAGFSGGARVAGSLALIDNSYAGVIACSAGLPIDQLTPKHRFAFFGLAGTEDLNYMEVKELEQSIKSTFLTHQFLISEGGHEWPTVSRMAFAIDFFEMTAMKNKNIVVNDSLINNFIKSCTVESNILKKQEKWTELERLYRMEISILLGLRKTKNLEILWNNCTSLRIKNNLVKIEKEVEGKEKSERNKFMDAFENQNIVWWQNEIVKIVSVCNRLNYSPEISMYKRLKGFLGLVTFMKVNQALNSSDSTNVSKYLFIYRSIEPENTEAYFLTAILSARNGDTKSVFDNLHKALALGFNDLERCEGIKEFESLRNTEEYKKILDSLKNKH